MACRGTADDGERINKEEKDARGRKGSPGEGEGWEGRKGESAGREKKGQKGGEEGGLPWCC